MKGHCPKEERWDGSIFCMALLSKPLHGGKNESPCEEEAFGWMQCSLHVNGTWFLTILGQISESCHGKKKFLWGSTCGTQYDHHLIARMEFVHMGSVELAVTKKRDLLCFALIPSLLVSLQCPNNYLTQHRIALWSKENGSHPCKRRRKWTDCVPPSR